jgi:peptidoglycan/LPS O-acetylase OafA/YrhL
MELNTNTISTEPQDSIAASQCLPPPAVRSRPARETLIGLQGLRGMAAILVICDHGILTMNSKAGGEADAGFAWYFGTLGVQIFFAISGLTMILAHGSDFGVPGAVRKFSLRRLGRIIPLYWTTSLIYYFKLALARTAPGIGFLLLSLGFIPHLEPGKAAWAFGRPVYELGWTLEYEMFFYFIFAIALFAKRSAALAGLSLFFLGLAALHQWEFFPDGTILGYLGAPIVLFFVLGIGIGVLRNSISRNSSKASSSYPWGFWTSVSISSLAIIGALATAAIYGAGSGLATAASAAAALMCVLSCGLARPEPVTGLARPFAKALGDATYAIYLTHSFILGPAGKLTGKYAGNLPTWAFVAAVIPICVGFGWVVYKYVDGPASRWFGKLLESLTGGGSFRHRVHSKP